MKGKTKQILALLCIVSGGCCRMSSDDSQQPSGVASKADSALACHTNVVEVGSTKTALREGTNQADADAMCRLGKRFRHEGDWERAIYWLQRAASNGCERAIGNCYEYGYGVEEDEVAAVQWYRKAADKGDGAAMCELGNYCYRPYRLADESLWCCSTNVQWKIYARTDDAKAEAVRWFRKAADLGDVESMQNLAHCYRNGEGVRKDVAEADRWAERCLEKQQIATPTPRP